MKKIIKPKKKVDGVFTVPGDKSISHRAVMLGSIAEGITEIEGFLNGDDCRSTIGCFRELGVKIEHSGEMVRIEGKGKKGLNKPKKVLDVGNSGTTIRLMSGILAGQDFCSEITGDESIQKRPMGRIIEPIKLMGGKIEGKEKENLAPLVIEGGEMHGIEYEMPIASAQVKSAILLGGLYADSETIVREKAATRDHTEIMINYFGGEIRKGKNEIVSKPVDELEGKKVIIPGDISSAAYFIVAGLIIPKSELIITNVGVNFTRTGILTALKEMGGEIEVLNRRLLCGEWVGDIRVRSSRLQGCEFKGAIIPRMIDEIPILAVAAAYAEGITVISNAEELKVKESNRIETIVRELSKFGAVIKETQDGMIIEGGKLLKGSEFFAHNDHRIAMSLAIAALGAEGESEIDGAECVGISFTDFFEYIENL